MSTPTRTYRGRAVDELIPRIHQELGAEAIIVRRREGLTGGFLGFFQHPYVEIEAMAGTPGIDLYDEPEPAPPPAGPITHEFNGHYALGSLAPSSTPSSLRSCRPRPRPRSRRSRAPAPT